MGLTLYWRGGSSKARETSVSISVAEVFPSARDVLTLFLNTEVTCVSSWSLSSFALSSIEESCWPQRRLWLDDKSRRTRRVSDESVRAEVRLRETTVQIRLAPKGESTKGTEIVLVDTRPTSGC